MLNSLRKRLILSHLLPPLIIIPLMGILLIYAVESFILLPTLTRELRGDALLIAEILSRRPETWQNPETAASALLSASPSLGGRVMLLDRDGHLLASSDPADAARLGEIPVIIDELTPDQTAQPFTRTEYNTRLKGEAIDIIMPVLDSEQDLLGSVRITYLYDTVYEQLFQFRFLLGGILLVGLVLSAVIGYILALNISIPIQYVAEAIYDLATGQQQEPLPLSGPEEINLQITAVNFLVTRLNSLEKARRQLLANLVHELGRPLGAIRSGLQALMRGATQDPQLLDDLLTGMDEQVKRLQILLNDLAHLHDQVLGTLELDRQPLALSPWLRQTVMPWRHVAQDKNQNYVVIIPDNLPSFNADPNRLAQAVDNLVNNALKYTPQGGMITISASATEEEVVIRVSDDGPGITAEEQQAIFEPFFRGDQQRRIKQGMGLGLGIARELIIAHGGRLELISKPGKGSQFTIFIPRSIPALDTIASH
jgi:two-component system, OmpR family, sensor histidine kinase BaeS